jgi:hypothetical protein
MFFDNKRVAADLGPFKSHDRHVFYVLLHDKARRYKELVKTYNDSRQRMGEEVRKSKFVEMNNFRNPEVREKNACPFFFLLI